MPECEISEVLGRASRPAGRWILGLTADMPLLDALEGIFRHHSLVLKTEQRVAVPLVAT